MLVHMYMLEGRGEGRRPKSKIGIPIRRTRRRPSGVYSFVVLGVAIAVAGIDEA